MQTLNQFMLWLHIAVGFTALLVGSIPIFVEKGSLLHRQSGIVFYWAMAFVAVSAFWLVTFKNANPFLAGIGVFSFYNAYSGRRFLAFKYADTKASAMDWTMLSVLSINGLWMIVCAMQYATLHFSEAWGLAILYTVFGGFCFLMAKEDYQFYQRPDLAKFGKMQWFFKHLNRMLAAYIATWTAFVVVNFHHLGLPESYGIVPWLLPGFIGGFGIARWTKVYLAKFKL